MTAIGLPHYADGFLAQDLDQASITELTHAHFRDLGVSTMGHRKMILREAGKLAPSEEGSPFPAKSPHSLDEPKLVRVEPKTIFLRYAHRSEREEDFDISKELVLLVQQELQRSGQTVWIDKDGIRAGSRWRERITAANLEHARFRSFLSTRSARHSGMCLNEIATALGASKNIQTVLTQDERRVALPLTISHIQWHDFQYWREIRAGTKTSPMGEDWEAGQ